MVKKRLIFVLFYHKGWFYLSRNFILQKVGDIDWLINTFNFKNIGDVIDELVFINVERNRPSILDKNFFDDIEKLLKNVYVPFTIGGGISSIEEINKCFNFGCDKVLFSTAFYNNIELLDFTRNKYGNQALLINIDYKNINNEKRVFHNNGNDDVDNLVNYLNKVVEYKPGEIMLNCIDNDGTGFGYDYQIIDILNDTKIPIIISGGSGKPEHFVEVLNTKISAAAASDLFNFLGSGFYNVRKYLLDNNINVRNFE